MSSGSKAGLGYFCLPLTGTSSWPARFLGRGLHPPQLRALSVTLLGSEPWASQAHQARWERRSLPAGSLTSVVHTAFAGPWLLSGTGDWHNLSVTHFACRRIPGKSGENLARENVAEASSWHPFPSAPGSAVPKALRAELAPGEGETARELPAVLSRDPPFQHSGEVRRPSWRLVSIHAVQCRDPAWTPAGKRKPQGSVGVWLCAEF